MRKNSKNLTALTLAGTVGLAACVWAGCCDPETRQDQPDAGVPDVAVALDAFPDAEATDAGADATAPLDYRMGCFPAFDGLQLYRSEVSPLGDFVCCEYRSLEGDPPREPQLYCGTIDDIGQESPFFAVEVEPTP